MIIIIGKKDEVLSEIRKAALKYATLAEWIAHSASRQINQKQKPYQKNTDLH